MTNREWLESLSDEDFALWLCDGYPESLEQSNGKTITLNTGAHIIGRGYTDSLGGLRGWLKEERRT